MKQSPLHIYKKAFYLHYKENKPSRAAVLYKKLITQYPESDVSVYATMQLAKLKAEDTIDDASHPVHSGNRALVLLIVINFFLSFATIAGMVFYSWSNAKQSEEIRGLMEATGKFNAGMHEESFIILDGIKIKGKEDITPYVIAADFYCACQDYAKARKEYETYNRLFPGNALVSAGIDRINSEELAHKKSLIINQPPQDTVALESKDLFVEKKPKRPVREAHQEPPRRIIQKGDISYF